MSLRGSRPISAFSLNDSPDGAICAERDTTLEDAVTGDLVITYVIVLSMLLLCMGLGFFVSLNRPEV